MDIDLSVLNYRFTAKPLLIGGKAKEYYKIRKSGPDTDLVVTEKDYLSLSVLYPDGKKDLWGDKGVIIKGFEIWRTICLFDYDYLSREALETENYKIISLEKLLFLTALGIRKDKYLEDLKLIVEKIFEIQYKDFDKFPVENPKK